MQVWSRRATAISGLALALAACATVDQASTTPDTYFVREGMVNQINPPITAIWDMQVEVMNDEGNFDPALMTADTWAALKSHAANLDIQAAKMADAQRFIVADPEGELTEAPEGTDLAAIQQRLDTSPQAFRAMATAMRAQTAQLLLAAQAQDAARVTQLVNDLQPSCKSCHDVFWYPEES
ncbi:cytochrome c [Aurantiacibacter suaedae]|uniref:cytochrome c n=1 Tax=Aurantiacibacter suaedae TaxID=2545755 RepID=UPI0010F72E13|nr:cytochrome c [Aurantiacibacter suaedae]